ncbi:MAG: type II secretion system F family protein [Anaerolineales bacterium]|nr:type II secretion system F family protein [Anaerolineales bacterium]
MLVTILFFGGGLIVLLLLVGIIISVTSERSFVEERIGRYIEDEPLTEIKGEKQAIFRDWVDEKVERTTMGGRIAKELARADLKLKSSEYILLIIFSGFGVAIIGWFFGGGSPIFAAAGFVFGMLLPRFYVKRQQSQRLIRFSDQLPDMLNLMVNSLRAGYSISQAMEAVSKEMPPPISDEFRRVVQEMQLGVTMSQALDNLFRRIPSDDLDLMIAAMNVQREVGGNLAEILDTISYTIRERVRIKGEIRVLTAQVVYSGRFLSLMPVMIALVLWAINRPYMMMFFEEETRMIGIPVLIFGVLMVLAGSYVMNKIAAIEV